MAEQVQMNRASSGGRIMKVLRVLWRQRWTILATFALVTLGGFVYTQLATPIYTAQARLRVQFYGSSFGPASPAGDAIGTSLRQECELLQSPEVLLIAQDTLVASPAVTDQPNPVDYITRNLRVSVGRGDLIDLEFDAPSRDDAKDVLDAIIRAYRTVHGNMTQKMSEALRTQYTAQKVRPQEALDKAQAAASQLQRQIKDLRESADAEITKLKTRDGLDALQTGPVTTIQKQLEALRTATARVSQQVDVLTREYEVQRGRYATTPERQKALTEQERLFPPTISEEDHRTRGEALARLEADMERIRTVLRPAHPDYQAVANQLDRAREQYVLSTLRRLQTAQGDEKTLSTALMVLEQKAQDVREAEEKLDREQRIVTANSATLARIDERLSDLGEGAVIDPLRIQEQGEIVASATPTRPDKLRVMLAALIAGGVLGLVAGGVREWVSPRLHSVEDIKLSLGLPVMGIVPRMANGQSDKVRAQKVRFDRGSAVAEAYRTVRTAVQFRTSDRPAKTIVITSAGPADGKSTLVGNLAIAMAQAGKRVVLIDADFRRPVQHFFFDVDNSMGLSSVLQGEPLESAVAGTAVEGLYVLPCGPVPNNPSEMLNSERLLEVLDQLGKKYDQVIIDTAPVGMVADARILAASSDGTLLVVRAGTTPRKLAESACDALMSVGARMLGVVVNDVFQRGSADSVYRKPYNKPAPDLTMNGTPERENRTRVKA